MLTQEQIDQIVKEATDDPRVQTVLLAGSYAYGKPIDKSDLDVREPLKNLIYYVVEPRLAG